MMGRLESSQDRFFYNFCLDDVVPSDHLVRRIDAVLDLSWLHGELDSYYSQTGRPSIDPELMIRMMIIGYVFVIRSERQLCSDVQVNLAYRWFCRLTGLMTKRRRGRLRNISMPWIRLPLMRTREADERSHPRPYP